MSTAATTTGPSEHDSVGVQRERLGKLENWEANRLRLPEGALHESLARRSVFVDAVLSDQQFRLSRVRNSWDGETGKLEPFNEGEPGPFDSRDRNWHSISRIEIDKQMEFESIASGVDQALPSFVRI